MVEKMLYVISRLMWLKVGVTGLFFFFCPSRLPGFVNKISLEHNHVHLFSSIVCGATPVEAELNS